MAAFDFPASPTNGQVYAPAGGPVYSYNSASGVWSIVPTAGTGAYVQKVGDTMSGTLGVTPGIYMENPIGAYENNFTGRKGGKNRWTIQLGSAHPETGTNNGSDFILRAFNDDGSLNFDSFSIVRKTGAAHFTGVIGSSVGVEAPYFYASGRALIGSTISLDAPTTINGATTINGPATINGTTTIDGHTTSRGSVGGMSTPALGPKFEVQSSGAGNGAYMAFHIPGQFAAGLGIDVDSSLRIGGWSYGSVAYKIWHDGICPNSSFYVKMPSGLIFTWGYDGGATGDHWVTYPIAFPNICLGIMGSMYAPSLVGTATVIFHVGDKTTTAFVALPRYCNNGGGVGVASQPFFWWAWGY